MVAEATGVISVGAEAVVAAVVQSDGRQCVLSDWSPAEATRNLFKFHSTAAHFSGIGKTIRNNRTTSKQYKNLSTEILL